MLLQQEKNNSHQFGTEKVGEQFLLLPYSINIFLPVWHWNGRTVFATTLLLWCFVFSSSSPLQWMLTTICVGYKRLYLSGMLWIHIWTMCNGWNVASISIGMKWWACLSPRLWVYSWETMQWYPLKCWLETWMFVGVLFCQSKSSFLNTSTRFS